jgi:hypothetical protein
MQTSSITSTCLGATGKITVSLQSNQPREARISLGRDEILYLVSIVLLVAPVKVA